MKDTEIQLRIQNGMLGLRFNRFLNQLANQNFHYRLIAVNSISLVFALAANISLLLNMAQRLSFRIAQPITIIGWYIASILLIALVSAASTSSFRFQPRQEHALSQAYYYGVIAAALYFIIASMMILTVYGAYKGHYPKEFRLTASQRTLMLQTISFMVYMLLGALVFSYIEGWPYLDAVFWADFTMLTIGIGGEFVPKTHTGRSLLFPYAIGGIMMVGLVVGSVRSLVLERGKQKLSARFTETQRQKVLSSIGKNKHTIRMGALGKINLSDKGLSERERREQEFNIMRKVQQQAERKRRYTALAMSSTAALILWFFGALIFMFSEKPQGWSYFASLYFAYTTLLTIGYGDYTPSSNAGKAFFVFWTLLAVPTLTILISNMGDTVIKGFKDLTIWIGTLTVLPDEKGGFSASVKMGLHRLKSGKLSDHRETVPGASEDAALERLEEHIEEDELKEAAEAGEKGDTLERDIHFYHFILAKEITQLIRDVDASPPRQYTYDEWSYFLRLIGENEENKSQHREPRVNHHHGSHDRPDLGTADGGEREHQWSWLGVRSPLMGNKTESQWLLHRLTARLELEMKKMRTPNAEGRREPPPISMADLRRGSKNSESRSDSSPEGGEYKNLPAAEVRRRQKNG